MLSLMRPLVILPLALTGLLHAQTPAAVTQPAERWFPTSEPELLTSDADASLNRLWSWTEYADVAAKLSAMPRIVTLKERPPLSDTARFGLNFSFGGKNRSFAVDGSDRDGYVLYVDIDANGRLTDDEKLGFEKVNGRYSVTISRRVTEVLNGRETDYPLTIRAVLDEAVPPGGTEKVPVLRLNGTTLRKGIAQVGGVPVPFALLGHAGLYDRPDAEVIFDADGRGLQLERSSAPQRFRVSEGKARLGSAVYNFTSIATAARSRSRRRAAPAPERPTLEAGTAAPAFTFRDLGNAEHRLSDYRGKVLLLDFWATWCGPCRAEAPQLAALLAKYGPQGLVIVGVNPNDSLADVQSFMREFNLSWPTVREPTDGPIHRLFRINAWPTHILIGKDGTILANRVGAGDMSALIASAIK